MLRIFVLKTYKPFPSLKAMIIRILVVCLLQILYIYFISMIDAIVSYFDTFIDFQAFSLGIPNAAMTPRHVAFH